MPTISPRPYRSSCRSSEDVHFAEVRFARSDGHGVLFTNGTGTGKTYVGLGVIKRMVRDGKKNGLIVVPSQKLVGDWKRAANDLGLALHALENIKDRGRGVSITTYANVGENDTLADRAHDVPNSFHRSPEPEIVERPSARLRSG
jgi:superfamily II DNA or RNA helicase